MKYSVNYISLASNNNLLEEKKDIVGPEGPRGFDPFHLKPKAHAEEEEVPEDEWRESKLPECTAEGDPVLGRPKSWEKKAPYRPRTSTRGSQKRF